VFFPLVTFRRENALVLVNRRVETAFGPHRKFVAMTIAVHPQHEGVEAREFFLAGNERTEAKPPLFSSDTTPLNTAPLVRI